jgi:uncharacterized membrane protein YidH (DUF202 family)
LNIDPLAEKAGADVAENGASERVAINEAQLLLAEKRTSLAVMRTGITVFALPLSVLSVLVATSRYYDFKHALPLILPLLALCGGLVVLGIYLTHRAIGKIRRYDRQIQELKKKSKAIAEFVD